MPPRLSLFTARSIAYRTKPSAPRRQFAQVTHRLAQGDTKKTPEQPKGPNMAESLHVTEEQAEMDKIMGETPPDISQGTPVQEILKRDGPEAQKKAPEVMKQQMNSPTGQSSSGSKRAYSTSARRNATEAQLEQSSSDMIQFQQRMAEGLEYPDAGLGHKFPLIDPVTIPRTDHLKRRYDPVVDQVTKAIMRHGKLSMAQKNMSLILDILRTAPPPPANPALPGRNLVTSLARPALPLSPIEYLTAAIDSVSPLLKIRQQRGVAGGGASLPIPVPLGKRQRRRQAIQWILDSAEKRRETRLADRVAREIVSVAEGKSGAWERRALVHRLGVSARSNIKIGRKRS